MKSVKFRHFFIAAIVATLLAGCASFQLGGGSGQRNAADAAERIISAYNVSSLLAQADQVLTRSLMGELPDTVGTAQRQRLRQVIDDEFQPDLLTEAVRQRLEQQARQSGHMQSLTKAAAALETPLAQRMIGLQSEAGDDGFATGYNEFLQQPLDARRKTRLQQIMDLMQHMGIVDVQSAFQLVLLETMVEARNTVTPLEQDILHQQLTQLLDQNRRTLQGQLREQVPLILLYVYRDIDDATLSGYVDLQGSPALLWTNQALVKAIRGALEDAGNRVRQRLESAV